MISTKHNLLIVDDEAAQRQLLRAVLEKDYSITSASSAEEAITILKKKAFDLVITDQKMSGLSGADLLQWIKKQSLEIPVILLTAYGTIDSAVEAMKLGAEDFLTKPVKNPDELRLIVSRVLEKRSLLDQEYIHREETDNRFPPDVIAESEQMRSLLDQAGRVAPQPTSVLLTGESGTGKEVVARYIHRKSGRPEGLFVAVNCAALTESLLESELFGHEKGAFTGATQSKRGRFELAHGGTLFLDEIGEMGFELQSKLLRVLQEQQFERVGGTQVITVDVRVIAATNQDLQTAINEKRFREDLFYRLSVFPIHLPPLRERTNDILPLAKHFISMFRNRMDFGVKEIDPLAAQKLLGYDWPGNIRELQNSIERALIITQSDFLKPEDFFFQVDQTGTIGNTAHPSSLEEIEKEAILRTLERNEGDRKKTAENLGISLRTLQYRIKEYGLVTKKG